MKFKSEKERGILIAYLSLISIMLMTLFFVILFLFIKIQN